MGFAHRGLHGPGVPENSLAAFRAAVALGAGIECDVRLSADGEVMVVHDHDLQRLCVSPLTVEGSKAELIAAQRLLGTDETIPWLSELLNAVGGRVPILVEIKTCGGNAFAIAKAVAADLADYAGPVGVMSFDPQVGWWFARHLPYRRRGLVVKARWSAWHRWARIFAASPHFLAIDRSLLASRWAKRARSAGSLYSWTIRTAGDRKQAAVHADALIWEADGRP
jgi:glycerophosphoryl diester phosphodiesterase